MEELREKAKELKEREDEVRSKVDEGKAGLEEHKEKLRSIIEACKALYENFDDKRREVKKDQGGFFCTNLTLLRSSFSYRNVSGLLG